MSTEAANAARAKAAVKHKVAAYISDHYTLTSLPVCQGDLIRHFNMPKTTVNYVMRELQREQRVKCVGMAIDTMRDDVASNVFMYGPPDASPLAKSVVKVTTPRSPYEGKPTALREVRVKAPKYRGEKQPPPYRAEFTPMDEGSYDLWIGRNLAMLAR